LLEILTLLISFIISIPTGYYLKYVCDAKLGQNILRLGTSNDAKIEASLSSEIITPIILTSTVFFSLSLLVLMFQGSLPLNPNNYSNIIFSDALNLSISFITTTNLQLTSSTEFLSHLSQSILSLTTFVGSLIGISVAFILLRSFSNINSTDKLGNFYNDAINISCLFYLPFCTFLALLFVSQGSIQNFSENLTVLTLDGFAQIIPQGPVASFLAIKIFGVNGGGFFAASSAHPFENPNAFTNLVQIVSMLIIPSSILVCYGLKCHTIRHATLYLGIFYCLLLFSSNIVKNAEMDHLNNLEGKELHFDISGSSSYNTVAAVSSGSSNSISSEYSPISQLVFTVNILSGNLIFGGAGTGFTNFITMVILTVFLAGLMAGRAPILYGKRIDIHEITYIVIYMMIVQISIFMLMLLNALYSDFTLAQLPEIFFNLVSATNNNGMSIDMSHTNNLMIHSTTFSMFFGRLAQLTVALGIASSFANKHSISSKLYDINVHSLFFIILLLFVLIINLTLYLPFLVIWPILDIINIFH